MKPKPKSSDHERWLYSHRSIVPEDAFLFGTQEEALNYACFYYGTTTTTEVYRDGKWWYAATKIK